MINTGISSDPVRKEIETLDENKGSNLTMEQLSEVAGGGKDDDGGKGGVICPSVRWKTTPLTPRSGMNADLPAGAASGRVLYELF